MKVTKSDKPKKTAIEMDENLVEQPIREILLDKIVIIKDIRQQIKGLKQKEKEHKSVIDAFANQIRKTSPFDRYYFPELANIDCEVPTKLVLDEEMLMQEGVPADVIKRCKVEKKGKPFFKISFVGEKDEEGEEE